MKREEIIECIIDVVEDSQSCNHNEIVNQVYRAVKPHASIASRSAQRKKIQSGDYFGGNFIFMIELLDKCGLEVVVKK